MTGAKFGPAGNSDSFIDAGYKSSLQIPAYLKSLSLTAYEYQCGRGVNIGAAKAKMLGEEAADKNIKVSLHAPYYISLASDDENKRLNSVNYILDSARTVNLMGGDRIVIHPGACCKAGREEALQKACDTMKLALKTLDNENLSHIRICPETMGKINQLGTLLEVLELCKLDERMIPCIDFGHINARTGGSLKEYRDFEQIFNQIEDKLGIDRLREFHSHFSKVEYTKGGEKRHLTFEDKVYGPEFDYIAELTYKKNCSPVFICESAGTQTEDAVTMMNIYKSIGDKAE